MANTETTNVPIDLAQGDSTGAGGSALDAAHDNTIRGYLDNVAQAALRALGIGVILDGTAGAGLLSAGTGVSLNVAAGAANILVNPAINGCLGYVPLRWNAGTNLVPAGMTDNATWWIVLSVVIPSAYETLGVVNPDSRREQRATLSAQLSAQATGARPNAGIILGKVTWAAGVPTFDHSVRDIAGTGVLVLPDVTEPATLTNKLYSIATGVLKWAGKRIPLIASTLSNSQWVKTDGSGNLVSVAAIAESDVTNLTADLAAKVPTSRTISAGTGLSGGGDLSANRTLSLPNTGVAAGTYSSPTSITVDAQGRITAIS